MEYFSPLDSAYTSSFQDWKTAEFTRILSPPLGSDCISTYSPFKASLNLFLLLYIIAESPPLNPCLYRLTDV